MAEKSIKSNSLNFVTGPALLIFTYCTSPSQTLKPSKSPVGRKSRWDGGEWGGVAVG